MSNEFAAEVILEEWFNLGKSDAWAGQPKRSPQQDPLADSLYDLGYSEGETQRSPIPKTAGGTPNANGHG
jgi:hypothetical protein